MPKSKDPIGRRRFLRGSLGVLPLAGLTLSGGAAEAMSTDEEKSRSARNWRELL